MNSGVYNYNGVYSLGNFVLFIGAQTMIELINEDKTLLSNFELTYTEVQCGPEYFDYDYFNYCLTQY